MHVNISQEPLHTKIYRKNAAAQILGPHFVRACAVELHFNISKSHFIRKLVGKTPRPRSQPRTQTATLCEPAQSKCMPTSFQKYNLQEKCRSPEPRTTLCASLRGRTAFQHFASATLYGNLWEKCRTPKSAQNADSHFVRDCSVEMHVNIISEMLFHKSHSIRKFPGKMPQPRT